MQRRTNFSKHISDSNAGLTAGRYFRLMAMAFVEMFWSLTMIGLNVWAEYRNGLRPWTNWADVHSNFSRVGQFPSVFIPLSTWRLLYFIYWSIPISSLLFVGFFVLGRDTLQEYRRMYTWIKTLLPKCFTRKTGMASFNSTEVTG